MTIQQFIQKHGLSSVQFPTGKPAVLLMDDSPSPLKDQYEFYANTDQTIWVSLNRTQKKFRVVFHDLVSIYSDWMNIGGDYELAPLVK